MLYCFTDTATTAIYTLSLHDALPIFDFFAEGAGADAQRIVSPQAADEFFCAGEGFDAAALDDVHHHFALRSEEHTSELQSHSDLVCRLLLEKKNKPANQHARSSLRGL